MTRDPAADLLSSPQRPALQAPAGKAHVIGLDEYCRLLLAHRSIDRVRSGLPTGFQGLRDPHSGQTWIIREDALLQAS
jgi:hypothetical protein